MPDSEDKASINNIAQTFAPSFTPATPDARGGQFASTGPALAQIGGEMGDFADQQMKISQDAWLLQAKSQAELDAQKQLSDAQNTAKPGQPILPNVQDMWQKNAQTQLSGVDSPVLKDRYNQALNEIGSKLNTTAQAFDVQQQGVYASHNFNLATQNTGQVISHISDRGTIDDYTLNKIGEYQNTIDNLPITPDKKLEMSDAMRKGLVHAAEERKARLDAAASIAENALIPGFNGGQSSITSSGIVNKNPGNITSGGVTASSSSSVSNFVMNTLEGGDKLTTDSNGADVKFGINQAANPDVDVKNLTSTEANAIYKTRYWDKIDGDNLPAPMRIPAMAFAINAGPTQANKLIAQSGNDPDKFMELQKNFYQNLGQNPNYSAQVPGWMDRLDKVQAANQSQQFATHDDGLGALANEIKEERKISDPTELAAAIQDVTKQGNGSSPYAQKNIMYAAEKAINPDADIPNPGMVRGDGAIRTGDPLMSLLSLSEQQSQYQRFESIYRQDQYFKRQNNAMTGATVAQINEYHKIGIAAPDELIAQASDSSGQVTPSMQTLLTKTLSKQESIKEFSAMAPVDIQNALQAAKPLIDSNKATPADIERYETGTQMMATMNKQLQTPGMPIQLYARSTGNNFPPLDISDPKSIQQRAMVAKSAGDLYGIPSENAFFTQADKDYNTNLLNQASVKDKLGILNNLKSGIGDEQLFHGVMNQLRPNSPVTAAAGDYIGMNGSLTIPQGVLSNDRQVTPYTIGTRLLTGEALVNPAKGGDDGKGKQFPLPGDDEFRKNVPVEYQSIFRNLPQYAANTDSAVKSYYAALASEKGDYSGKINPDLVKQSYQDLLGSATSVNGNGFVTAPWGVSKSDFTDSLAKTYAEQAPLQNINTSKFPFKSVGFQNTGNFGRYLVTSGTGYLLDKKGNPVMIDTIPKAVPMIQAGNKSPGLGQTLPTPIASTGAAPENVMGAESGGDETLDQVGERMTGGN